MTARPWPEQAVITDPEAVRLLTSERSMRIMRPFLDGEHTLSSAGRALARPASSVAYWVPQLVSCGLIEQVDVLRRAGRPMPVYRAVARQLRVPFTDLPFDQRVAFLDGGRLRLLRRFLDGLDEMLEREPDVSLGFSTTQDGALAVELLERPDQREQRPYADGWQLFRLDEADARQLSREMEDLIARYVTKRGGGRYIAHIGLVAEPRFRWRSANDPSTP